MNDQMQRRGFESTEDSILKYLPTGLAAKLPSGPLTAFLDQWGARGFTAIARANAGVCALKQLLDDICMNREDRERLDALGETPEGIQLLAEVASAFEEEVPSGAKLGFLRGILLCPPASDEVEALLRRNAEVAIARLDSHASVLLSLLITHGDSTGRGKGKGSRIAVGDRRISYGFALSHGGFLSSEQIASVCKANHIFSRDSNGVSLSESGVRVVQSLGLDREYARNGPA